MDYSYLYQLAAGAAVFVVVYVLVSRIIFLGLHKALPGRSKVGFVVVSLTITAVLACMLYYFFVPQSSLSGSS